MDIYQNIDRFARSIYDKTCRKYLKCDFIFVNKRGI